MIHKAPVLSPNLAHFLAYAHWMSRDRRDDGRGTLGAADALLKDITTEELEAELKRADGFEPFGDETVLVGTTPINAGRVKLNQEFFGVLDEWGELYPIELLLNASKYGLSTQMAVKDIQPGNGFEIDGKLGRGKVIMQFQVALIDEELERPGKVPYIITHGAESGDGGRVRLMDENTMVRPLIPSDGFGLHSVGSSFDDPEKFVQYKNDQDEYRAAWDAIEGRILEQLNGEPMHVIYSAYETKENGTPIDNLDEIAVQGRVVLVQDTPYDHEESEYSNYESEVLENPTWLQVALAANKMIATTGDNHHVFLEGVHGKTVRDDGVKVRSFSMGS